MNPRQRTIAEFVVARRFPDLDPHPNAQERLRRGPRTPTLAADVARVWAEQVAECRAWLRSAAQEAAERRAWNPALQDMTGVTAIDLWADRLDVDGRHEDAEEVRAFRDRIQAVDALDPLTGRVRFEPPTGQFTGPIATVHRFTRPAGDPA